MLIFDLDKYYFYVFEFRQPDKLFISKSAKVKAI